jgi:hypothetical protein
MQGGNPYMQPSKPGAPVEGGDMNAGMAPLDDQSSGTSETTKPRQMPGGAPAMPPSGGPVGAPGMNAGGPAPSPQGVGVGQGGDTNVPQDSPKSTSARLRVQAIRQDIMRTNPEISTRHAHAIALQVVALQDFTAASPMGPAPNYQITNLNAPQQRRPQQSNYSEQQQIIDPSKRQQQSGQAGRIGDLNDPSNPYSPLHPNHPMYRQYGGQEHGDPLGKPGDFVSQNGGRNSLEDHAYSKGYRGQYPHAYAFADLAANQAVDWFRNRKAQPPATRSGKQGEPGARVMP